MYRDRKTAFISTPIYLFKYYRFDIGFFTITKSYLTLKQNARFKVKQNKLKQVK